MAPAREENANSYAGLGAGGKFRKPTFRRAANSKPYDRPPNSLRTQMNGHDRSSNGWLAKLVDPAQRLITASAHRLFASVFRKRLSPQLPELGKEARDEHGDVVSSPKRAQVTTNGGNSEIGNSGKSEVFELEQTLKKETFTRTEIDRLTALLHSRKADMPSGHEEKRSERTPSKALFSREGKSSLDSIPVLVHENGVESHLASTPLVNQSVLDEDFVSPTELAKTYMDSRISKASHHILGGHSQARRDDTTLLGSQHIPKKSPETSLVSWSGPPSSASDDGFITPKSRGRSAIYDMARTPYSRVNSRSMHKDGGIQVDINGRPSSSVSLSIWEQNKVSVARQGSLKRKSSVLENDIGSVGPMRKIRQKPHLLSSRSMIQPAYVTSLSAPRPTVGANAFQDPSSPMEKPSLSVEPKYKFTLGNGESGTPARNFPPVSTKSSEMASKMLQQLDKLVSSPTKLLPSMLSGKALRSLEKVDSSRFIGNVQDFNKVVASSMFLPASRDSASQKLDKTVENGPKELLGLPEKVTNSAIVLDSKDTASRIKSADIPTKKSDPYNSQKKRAFQMSIPDDFLDWYDDSYPNGVVSSAPADDKGKQKFSDSDSKIVSTEAISIRPYPDASDSKHSATSNTGMSDGTLASENNAAFTFPSPLSTAADVNSLSQKNTSSDKVALTMESNGAPLVSSFGDKVASSAGPIVVTSTPIVSFGDKVSQPTESNVSPIFKFEDKIATVKEVNAASTIISFDSKNVDKTPVLAHTSPTPVPGQSCPEASALPTFKSESSSGLANSGSEKPIQKSNISKIPDTTTSSLSASLSTSDAGMFFSGPSANGSLARTSFSTAFSSETLSNFTSQSASSSFVVGASTPGSASTAHVSAFTTASFNSSSTSPGASTFSSAPAIKFDSATVPSTMSSTLTITPSAESDDKTKHSTNCNLSSSPIVSTSQGANTGGSIFGFAPVSSSAPNNSSQGSTSFSSGFGVTTSSPFTAQTSSSGSGIFTSSQSMQSQIGSSPSSPSFSVGGNTSLSGSSYLFGSSCGNNSGQSSLVAPAVATSVSSDGAITDASASTLQPGKSSIFGSTFSTNGVSFGASSTAIGASNASPVVFGSSNSSSSLNFAFTSSTPPTLAQSAFGNHPVPSQPVSSNLSGSLQSTFGNSSSSPQTLFGNSSNSSRPAFGSSSAPLQQSASSQPSFGSTSTASLQPAFGGTSAASFQSALGGTSAASLQSAFGSTSSASLQSSFGGTSSAASEPIFSGASAASQPIFGGASTPSQPIFGGSSASSHPAFGNTSASSQPAFGSTSSSSQPAFGRTSSSSQPAFGNTLASSQPAFGNTSGSSQPAFGNTSGSSQPAFGNTSASSQPAFGNTSASSQPEFGNTSASSQPAFGNTSASSQPAFGNTSASSQPAFGNILASSQPAFGNILASSQPAFGNHSSGFPFGLSSAHNNQISMEDSMAEDTVQASAPASTTSIFGQQSISAPQSGFVFGSAAPSGPSQFQFGSQQNMSTPQNSSPFQASASLDFHGGGSFSLGTGGGDKPKRKIIKVKHRGRK